MFNIEIIEKRLQTLRNEAVTLRDQRLDIDNHFRGFHTPSSATLEAWHKAVVEIEDKLNVIDKNVTMLREVFSEV